MGEIDEESTTPNIPAIAAALARWGGLNDASLWTSRFDGHPGLNQGELTRVLEGDKPWTLSPVFANAVVSFQYVAGLNTTLPPTTPIAVTRGLQPDGQWANDPEMSVYGQDGGYIAFLDGNVVFFKDLGKKKEQLVGSNRKPTANILETIGSNQRIFSYPATPTGAVDGMPGIGSPANRTPAQAD